MLEGSSLYYQDNQQNAVPVTVPDKIRLPNDGVFANSEYGRVIVLICAVGVIGFFAYFIFKKK